MGRYLLCFILAILSLFSCACAQQYQVDILLEGSHPWERASGRSFWYTLVYCGEAGLEQATIPIGSRNARIVVPRSQTIVCAAYPLGTGIPFGGAATLSQTYSRVTLTMEEGPLCDTLLRVAKQWPNPVGRVNYDVLLREVRLKDVQAFRIDWNRLSREIISGKLSSSSVRTLLSRDVRLTELPAGKWVGEYPGLGSFSLFTEGETTIGHLPAGLFRFVNLGCKLELRVLVPADPEEDPFAYMAPLDTLLAISDSAYHALLGRFDDFP